MVLFLVCLGVIGQVIDYWLYQQVGQWCGDLQFWYCVDVCVQCFENVVGVGILQGEVELDFEKIEIYVLDLLE